MTDEGKSDNRIGQLVKFGLTPLQAKAYACLLQTGTASAYKVAKNARIHRVEAYRALGQLKNLGLVEKSMGRPTLFQPVPPSRGVQLLIDEVAMKLKELNKAKQETVRWLKSISTTRQEIEKSIRFRLIEGTKSLRETTHQMWSNAEKEVLFTRDQAQIRVLANEELVASRHKLILKGIRLRGVSEIHEENLQDISSIAEFVELRHLNPMNLHMDIIDCSEVLLGAIPNQGEEPLCVWTDSLRHVVVLRELFERLWEEAFPAVLRITELQPGGFSIYQEYESLKKDLRVVLLDQTTDALEKFFHRGMELRKRLGVNALGETVDS